MSDQMTDEGEAQPVTTPTVRQLFEVLGRTTEQSQVAGRIEARWTEAGAATVAAMTAEQRDRLRELSEECAAADVRCRALRLRSARCSTADEQLLFMGQAIEEYMARLAVLRERDVIMERALNARTTSDAAPSTPRPGPPTGVTRH